MDDAEVFSGPRTVVVTGAASPRGIGRGCAEYLAGQGWSVGIIDLDETAAAATAAEIARAHQVRAVGVGADVSDEPAVCAAFDRFEAELPQLVALVNVAAVASPTRYVDLTHEEWDRVIAVNLTGVHHTCRRAVESMVRNRLGRIVNVSSVAAQRGGGGYSKTAYAAAKAGVLGFTRSLARELGYDGITANAVAPGPVDTDFMGGRLDDDRMKHAISTVLLPRIGTPRDIAAGVAYLVSEDAGFVTGQTLNIDGGIHMH